MNYDWSDKNILIAEDDHINFKYLQLLIEKRTRASIIWAMDGKEAIENIRQNPEIDLVLLDLQLPEINGIIVLSEGKSFNPYLPIIMQTANSWNNEQEECILAGCDGFYSKPLNIDALFSHMDCSMKEYSYKKNMVRNLVV